MGVCQASEIHLDVVSEPISLWVQMVSGSSRAYSYSLAHSLLSVQVSAVEKSPKVITILYSLDSPALLLQLLSCVHNLALHDAVETPPLGPLRQSRSFCP